MGGTADRIRPYLGRILFFYLTNGGIKMKQLTTNELRRLFLQFFESKNHDI